uniref:ABC transporter domain-containing protein n=1 Tax=Ditylum brightwellii TaxID=49249 RepID=A0A6V2DZI5_9STRA
MGIIVGTVFWQIGNKDNINAQALIGIIFQSLLFITLGAQVTILDQITSRGIFYKQQDANFFPTWSFVLGSSIAYIPTAIIDAVAYGTIVFWFAGLASDDGASVANYFAYLLILLVSSLSFGLTFSVFAAAFRDKSSAIGGLSLFLVIIILFSGFTVQASLIPDYWIWVYWCNLFAWFLRALVVNEFRSGKYDYPDPNDPSQSQGEAVLRGLGFTLNGEPFTFEWLWYALALAVGVIILSILASVFFLTRFRYETGKALSSDVHTDSEEDTEGDEEDVEIPFKRATLTFRDVHYYVTASVSDEKLELLKGVDGFIEAGKLTALMGSSGAGKTTLMDVLSLRKSGGEITGEVRVNGHLQEPNSFRRCTGYVEQFDTQSPQLTIRETVRFSAKLRLDENDPTVTDESIDRFVTQNLKLLELDLIEDFQVGSDIEGGLSFEQRKRLSIAVELVANPSILFLDEPTSGLDARAASIVMRGLKRIALGGRAVCATIHQPSTEIFNGFDSLLLLKRGGEPVFFGELGNYSYNLITYFERFEATQRINPGENPGTWMLTTIGAGQAERGFDYAASYAKSKLREEALEKIEELNSQASDENLISFSSIYATSLRTQFREMRKRLRTIYWRNTGYNNGRLIIAAMIALLFGTVYVSSPTPKNESDMMSRVTSIYVTTTFLGVTALNTILPVFEVERNMFYRHRAARMYKEITLISAIAVAEIPFLMISSMIFCVCWYFMARFSLDAGSFFLYYLFIFLNNAAFAFVGQVSFFQFHRLHFSHEELSFNNHKPDRFWCPFMPRCS